jgi:hypothetical protein
MAQKLDVYSLPRVERVAETREWVLEDGRTISLTLRAANAADAAVAGEAANQLIDDFITGETRGEPADFFDPEVKVSRQLFMTCATIAEMQAEPVYTATELCILFDKRPEIGNEVQVWAAALNRGREKRLEGPERAPFSG